MFFVCPFVTLWNDKVCDNGNAMKRCNLKKTIMVSLHRGRFVVVHIYLRFSMDPQDFPLEANFYPKNTSFDDYWGRKPAFLKPQW